MARLGISLYPEHSAPDKDKAYVTLAAKYGFKQTFTCLLNVEKEREEILAEFRELIDHVHSYGMEVILDVAPFISEKLHVSYDGLSLSAEMHADGTRLDEESDSLKEALVTYNPQNLEIEINISLGTKYLDNIMSHYPKLDNVITCHNFYPQRYSGISYEHFEKCSQDIKDLNIKVAAFASSQEEGTYGPWPVNEGLCTLKIHRDLPIDVQVRYLFATRLVDDVTIASVRASEKELSTLSEIDPDKPTLKIDFEVDLHPTEEEILYEHPHFVCGDISEYMARNTMLRATYAKESVPPKNTRDLKRGDIVVVNDECSYYKGELRTVLKGMPNDGRKNVTGHVPEGENMLLDYIKSWKSFGFARQYQERGGTMVAPIYRKIKDLIMQEVEGKAANSPIDSECNTAVRFDASRMTIRKAIDELVDESFLYRDKNKETFVVGRKLLKKNTVAEILQEEISEFAVMYLSVKDAADITPTLETDQDDQVLSVVRLNTANSKPTSIEEIFFIRNRISDVDMKDLKNLLDMSDYVKNGRVTQKLIPMLIPVQFTDLLKIKMNTPIIRVELVISSMSGKSLVYVRAYNNPFENVIEITL